MRKMIKWVNSGAFQWRSIPYVPGNSGPQICYGHWIIRCCSESRVNKTSMTDAKIKHNNYLCGLPFLPKLCAYTAFPQLALREMDDVD